ncbi:MAG: hypothetical protein ABFS86_01915 [Planctomycetota bacterium]
MRVVILHESPGADGLRDEFVAAAEEFNRGLDIRLRFLDVGFTFREVPVREPDDFAAVTFSETFGAFGPSVVLALGRGPRLLECIAAAAKTGRPVLYLEPPEPDRTSSAIARIAPVLVTTGGSPADRRPDRFHLDGRPVGPALVDIIVRSVREDHRS